MMISSRLSFAVASMLVVFACKDKKKDPAVAVPPQGSDQLSVVKIDGPPPPPPPERCKLPKLTLDSPGCEPPCRGNSPMVNTFPINGLDGAGTGLCNPEGIQVMPGTLSGGGCAAGSTLRISDDKSELVAVDGGGGKCEGNRLKGASFTVRSIDGEATLKIDEVKDITVDDGQDAHTTPMQKMKGYKISDGDGKSLILVRNLSY